MLMLLSLRFNHFTLYSHALACHKSKQGLCCYASIALWLAPCGFAIIAAA